MLPDNGFETHLLPLGHSERHPDDLIHADLTAVESVAGRSFAQGGGNAKLVRADRTMELADNADPGAEVQVRHLQR